MRKLRVKEKRKMEEEEEEKKNAIKLLSFNHVIWYDLLKETNL